MKVCAVANQKGGVGKTSIAYHLAVGVAEKGYRVLAIDTDPQGNLSYTFRKNHCSAAEMYSNEPKLTSTVCEGSCEKGRVEIVTSDGSLAEVEAKVSIGMYAKMKKALAQVDGKFDIAIIDCPPSLNVFTINALVASTHVLIPTQPMCFSIVGMQSLMTTIEEAKQELNPGLSILGILLNQADRTTETTDAIAGLAGKHGSLFFTSRIPRGICVERAIQRGIPVWKFDATHQASVAMKAVVDEFTSRIFDLKGEQDGSKEGRIAVANN